MKKKHIGLFEGVGGFSLAAHWAGYETVAWCEWDKRCQQVLNYYFPTAEGFGDINESDFSKYENEIDILTAGFPCQPVSLAGQRKGTEDERWGWPQTRRVIEQVKPKWVILENVAGLLSILEQPGKVIMETKTTEFFGESYCTETVSETKRVLGTIIAELQESGYFLPTLTDGTPIILCVPACAVNAPHRRDRVWIVAYSEHHRKRSPRNSSRNEGDEFAALYETGQKRKGQTVFNTGLRDLQRNIANSDQWGQPKHQLPTGRYSPQSGDSARKPTADPNSQYGRQQLQFCRSYGAWSWSKFSRSSKGQPTADSDGVIEKQPKQKVEGVRPELARYCKTGVLFTRFGEKYRSGLNAEPSTFTGFPTQSPICSRNDGLSSRLVGITVSGHQEFSIKSYGNAIVPELAFELMQIIHQVDNQLQNHVED